jgi:RND family efflux transporter MFP subunit
MKYDIYRWLRLTGVFAALTALTLTIGCGGAASKNTAALTVKKGTFEVIIPAFGELKAVKSTPIAVPSQLQGNQTIAWLAPENVQVKKGQTVIRLNASIYQEHIRKEEFNISKLDLEILQKKQQLEKEKSELESQLNIAAVEEQLAEAYGARDESLYSRHKIIEDTLNLDYLKRKASHYKQKIARMEQKAKAELQLLELKKRTYKVKVEQYRQSLDSLEIKAPHDGLFIHRRMWRGEKVRVGMNVWRGGKLGELPDLNEMEAKIHVLESEAAGLKEDLPVSLMLDSAPDQVFTGKVKTVASIAKPLDRESPLKYFEVIVSLDTTDPGVMKPGSQLNASISVYSRQDVIAVPNQALVFEKEHAYVSVKNSSGIEKRPVETGERSLTRTIIENGLNEGEKILLSSPQHRMDAGDKKEG